MKICYRGQQVFLKSAESQRKNKTAKRRSKFSQGTRYLPLTYINSWILFFELYNLIERQVDRGWIQPLELEYYYKCARILSDIPEDKAVRMGMQPIKAEDIKRIEVNDFQKSNFMNKILFNDNLREVYKKYFRDKMESYRLDNIVEQY